MGREPAERSTVGSAVAFLGAMTLAALGGISLAVSSQGAVPPDPLLVPGTPLPAFEATTLAGEAVALPGEASMHGAVLVVGFSKEAATLTSEWMDGCLAATRQPGREKVACYDVRMLEEVPRLFRGMMEKGMKKGYPADRQKRTLLVYSDNETWRGRLGAKDKDSAYVLGCDATGRVRLMATGAYVETELRAILDAIAPPS